MPRPICPDCGKDDTEMGMELSSAAAVRFYRDEKGLMHCHDHRVVFEHHTCLMCCSNFEIRRPYPKCPAEGCDFGESVVEVIGKRIDSAVDAQQQPSK